MPQVNCSVANCEYWAQGNKCSADEILVEINAHAQQNLRVEFAGEYGQGSSTDTNHQDTAKHSSETCCLTFKPKSQEK
ncbi:DUF1540 domain-containing protein [Brevibacillus sp. AY1]|uniref:DUF1540 domain-containing protein n=1 Tax=Brevibacillus sp. AY1 TaxID=2807621 RepID=UPI002456A957|nr:DUF1540 domain-containing protein [Brevibacillus sp. AY1]MDH4618743.1 DUF1540 domain-containing protein [Brevibacillus sp. AY1]